VPQDGFAVDLDLESGFPAIVIGYLLAELIRLWKAQAGVQFADGDGRAMRFGIAGFFGDG
jgi:hypothetical protein